MENLSTDERLGTESIPKLMFSLALPSVTAQIINVLYNIVDRIYIGHIPETGSLALPGIGVCFPILMLISAFSAFAGMGGAPLASIQLGKRNKEKAEQILGNACFLILVFSILLTIFFSIFKRPLLFMFGASENTLPYADEYISIYLAGTIFVQIALGLNTFISSQGRAKTAMFSVLIGAVSNIILDPIFIFGLNMGVSGAALATIISQAISAVWVLCFLLSKRSVIKIKLSKIKPNGKILLSISSLGISPFIMQSTESAISIVLNNGLQRYGGDLHVAAMTILTSVIQVISILSQGFSQGVQPIISYNFGAGKFDRVIKTFKITITSTFLFTAAGCALASFFPEVFASFFTQDQELIQLVGKVLPIYLIGMWIFGIQSGCQSTFIGLGQAKISLFIALLRKVILLIPLAIILPMVTGNVMGIYCSEPIADAISATTAGLLFLLNYKKILSHKTLEKMK